MDRFKPDDWYCDPIQKRRVRTMNLLIILSIKGLVTVGGLMLLNRKKKRKQRSRSRRIVTDWAIVFPTKEKEEGLKCLVGLLTPPVLVSFKFPYSCVLLGKGARVFGRVARISVVYAKGERGMPYRRQGKELKIILIIETQDGKIYYADDLGVLPEFRDEMVSCGFPESAI